MATCNKCGEEITFRWIDGRCVPIHPGGGWNCGSWSETRSASTSRPRADWQSNDFTRPSRCPECGKDVFFIRHNGGSVWVDELGWPWPKHGCFDKPNTPTHAFSSWSAKASGLTHPKVAVVTCIRTDPQWAQPVVELKLNDSTRVSLVLQWTPSTSTFLGSLVILSREDHLLIHPTEGEIAFHGLVELLPESYPKLRPHVLTGSKWRRCENCQASVLANHYEGHLAHCRKYYKSRAPITPPPPAPERELPPVIKAAWANNQRVIEAAVQDISRRTLEETAHIKEIPQANKEAKRLASDMINRLSRDIRNSVRVIFERAKWDQVLRNLSP